MKYIKKFENIDNDYKVGDYLKLRYSSRIFKIIEINYKWNNPYKLEFYLNGKLSNMNCINNDIERFATPLEIESMELKINTNKYNL